MDVKTQIGFSVLEFQFCDYLKGDHKTTREIKVYFSLEFHIIVLHLGMSEKLIKQDKNLEAGANAEVWEIMLTGLLLMACLAYLPIATHYFEHGGEELPSVMIPHQSRQCPIDLPAGHSYGGIFLIKISSFQMTLTCIKLS